MRRPDVRLRRLSGILDHNHHHYLARMVALRVGPRDGFQNEAELISTNDTVRLIDQLARPGIGRLEVTSLVFDVTAQFADGDLLNAFRPSQSGTQ